MTSKKSKSHLAKMKRVFLPKKIAKPIPDQRLPVEWVCDAGNKLGRSLLMANQAKKIAQVDWDGKMAYWMAFAPGGAIDHGMSLDETTAMLMATMSVINHGLTK